MRRSPRRDAFVPSPSLQDAHAKIADLEAGGLGSRQLRNDLFGPSFTCVQAQHVNSSRLSQQQLCRKALAFSPRSPCVSFAAVGVRLSLQSLG